MSEHRTILPEMTGAYELELAGEAATQRLGRALAGILRAGDLLALWGDLGMGKSSLARALIQERLSLGGRPPEDVPSPTFTLVQTYEAGDLSLAHFDLYRIADPAEIYELGLEEALEEGAALIEWPGNLEELLPQERLDILLEPSRKGRRVRLKGTGDWGERLAAVMEMMRGEA